MNSPQSALDLIEELRLRRWARLNYVPAESRSSEWHPIVHNEMELRDFEEAERAPLYAEVVPLRDFRILRLDRPHPIGRTTRALPLVASEPPEFHYS